MGIVSWFRSFFGSGLPAIPESDHIWLTTAAKLRGILADVETSRARGEIPFLVAHFPNTLAGLERLSAGTGWPTTVIRRPCSERELAEQLVRAEAGTVFLVQSDAAPAAEAGAAGVADFPQPVAVIMMECHPLARRDQQVRRLAVALPFPCRLQTHLSLEDAVMRVFAGEWASNMLRTLGMKEHESIQSPMVMKRIRAAQKKIETKTVGAQPAQSAEEWFQLNCPELWPGE